MRDNDTIDTIAQPDGTITMNPKYTHATHLRVRASEAGIEILSCGIPVYVCSHKNALSDAFRCVGSKLGKW